MPLARPCDAHHVWSEDQTMELLRLYRDRPWLWNVKDPHYPSRKLRKVALKDISEAMGIGLTSGQISKKLKALRAHYRLEKQRIKERTGKGDNVKITSNWFALAHSFLKDANTAKYVENHAAADNSESTITDPEINDDALPQSEFIEIKMEDLVTETVRNDKHIKNDTPITDADANSSIKSENKSIVDINEPRVINNEQTDFAPHAELVNVPPKKNNEFRSIHEQKIIAHSTKTIKNRGNKKEEPYPLKETSIWPLKDNVKFLRLYGAHSLLWDQNNPHFSSSKMRNAAHQDIAAAMGRGMDADYVFKRIQTLRIAYMKHRKRMIEEIKQNREPSFKTILWFPLADSFLRPHIGLRSIIKGERELPQFDYKYVYDYLKAIDPGLLEDLNVGCI
ncbi:uncharacterized protein [Eurosta solidaginis]|uniref:uncharacterized protein n=1 Tax=Eurosta solidaginis TaxID=178769 RepID=UPI00353136F6